MSKATTAALALALGAGAGFAIYRFTRDDRKPRGTPEADALATAPRSSTASTSSRATTATPPRKPGPCSLKLDQDALTLEGERVDIPTAVARCQLTGRAELAVAPNAPLAVNRELYAALLAAGVPTVVKTP